MDKLSMEYSSEGSVKLQNADEEQLAKLSRVLLVEDHRVAEKVTKNMLLALHCQVDVAYDGKTAIDKIQQRMYDLVLMDVGLPDMNGDEVTRRIRRHELTGKGHVPIIALTAHEDNATQQACLNAGMNAVLSKPIHVDEAAKVLSEVIPARKAWLKRQKPFVTNEQQIVDIQYAKQLLGDAASVKEALTLLVESLPYEVKKLEDAYQQQNWLAVQVIANKLKGGASYCGTLRLKSACAELDNIIQSGLLSQAADSYQRLLAEIHAVQKFFTEQSID